MRIPILHPVMVFFNIFFVFTVFDYIHELKQKKCECSRSLSRDVLEIVNYVQVALIIVLLLTIAIGSMNPSLDGKIKIQKRVKG
jgi:uncharacterized membrane protein YphA (DoxX/SURF4 family)